MMRDYAQNHIHTNIPTATMQKVTRDPNDERKVSRDPRCRIRYEPKRLYKHLNAQNHALVCPHMWYPFRDCPNIRKHCRHCQKCPINRTGQRNDFCSACEVAYYCSKRCQKQDWRKHKPICGSECECVDRRKHEPECSIWRLFGEFVPDPSQLMLPTIPSAAASAGNNDGSDGGHLGAHALRTCAHT